MWLELLSAGRKDYEHSRVIAFVSEGGVLGKSQSIAAHRRKVMEDMHGLYMCSCIPGISTPLLLHRLLHKQETTHFPETGFVDNGIEASDVLVCQCHMCSRGRSREVWCQLWGRWFPVSGWLPGFSWRARIVALFASELSSNTRTRHPRERREHRVVLPVLQHAWWFQTQANSKHTQLVRGSRPAKLVSPLSGESRWQGHFVLTASTETLCCFHCLTLQCRSVHWCHPVFKKLVTWP